MFILLLINYFYISHTSAFWYGVNHFSRKTGFLNIISCLLGRTKHLPACNILDPGGKEGILKCRDSVLTCRERFLQTREHKKSYGKRGYSSGLQEL